MILEVGITVKQRIASKKLPTAHASIKPLLRFKGGISSSNSKMLIQLNIPNNFEKHFTTFDFIFYPFLIELLPSLSFKPLPILINRTS